MLRLQVENFRAHRKREWCLFPGVTHVDGISGIGKTSLLESILFSLGVRVSNTTRRGATSTRVSLSWWASNDHELPTCVIERKTSPKTFTLRYPQDGREFTHEAAQLEIEHVFGRRLDVTASIRQSRQHVNFFASSTAEKAAFLEELFLPRMAVQECRQLLQAEYKEARVKSVCQEQIFQSHDRTELFTEEPASLEEQNELNARETNARRQVQSLTTQLLELQRRLSDARERLQRYHVDGIAITSISLEQFQNDRADLEEQLQEHQRESVTVRSLIQRYQEECQNAERIRSKLISIDSKLTSIACTHEGPLYLSTWSREECQHLLTRIRDWEWEENDILSTEELHRRSLRSVVERPAEVLQRARRFSYNVLASVRPRWSCPECLTMVHIDPVSETLVKEPVNACTQVSDFVEVPDARSISEALQLGSAEERRRYSTEDIRRWREAKSDWDSLSRAFPSVILADVCSGFLLEGVQNRLQRLMVEELQQTRASLVHQCETYTESPTLLANSEARYHFLVQAIGTVEDALRRGVALEKHADRVQAFERESRTITHLEAEMTRVSATLERVRDEHFTLQKTAEHAAAVSASKEARDRRLALERAVAEERVIATVSRSLETVYVEFLNRELQRLNDVWQRYLDRIFVDEPLHAWLEWKRTEKTTRLLVRVKWKDMHTDDFGLLSGGEFDRFHLAFQLALSELCETRILLLDEALSTLDEGTLDHVTRVVQETAVRRSLFVICVSHQTTLSFAPHRLLL